MENGPFIVDLPIEHGDFTYIYIYIIYNLVGGLEQALAQNRDRRAASLADVWEVVTQCLVLPNKPVLTRCSDHNGSCLSNGAPVSVVIDSLIWAQNSGVGKVVPGEQVVRLVGLIPSKVTVLSASFLSAGPVVDLVLDDTSLVLAHQPLSADHVFNLVELCSGVGISSIGFSRAGFRHRCSVERQPKLAELHSLLHPGSTIQLSVLTSPMTQQPALFLRIALTLAPSCQALHVSRFHGVALSEDNRTADRHHFLELFV